jgi:hypothetical protein
MKWLMRLFGYEPVLLFHHDGEVMREWSYVRDGRRYVNWVKQYILILNPDHTVTGRKYIERWEHL